MKSFTFSLQNVLDVQTARRDAVEQELGHCLQELDVLQVMRRTIAVRIEKELQLMAASMRTGFNVQEYRRHGVFIEECQRRMLRVAEQINEIETKAEAIRKRLADAMRRCKTTEKLRDKERVAWDTVERRLEQDALDEVAVTGYYRKIREQAG